MCFVIVGEVVGASSFSVGHGSGVLKKIASVRMLHPTSDAEKIVCHPLKRRVCFLFKLLPFHCLAIS